MGIAASIDSETTIDLITAKKEAGERWTSVEDEAFASKFGETGTISLRDARCIAPKLFYGDNITIENAKLHAQSRGVEWNEELENLYNTNNITTKTDSGEEIKGSILTDTWKSIVPTLFETESEREIRLHNEYIAKLAERSEGNVVINYQMYNEEFPISNNTLTADRIDEDYGLTDIMPGCRIKLSTIDSKSRTLYENAHDGLQAPWVQEDPIGTFKNLLSNETYYCIVFEDSVQYEKDMLKLQEKINNLPKEINKTTRTEEGCSCLYGNPCMDQYICKDWNNRYAIAKLNGWKGF